MWNGVPQGYYAHCPEDPRALVESANFGPDQAFALFGRAGNLADAARMAHYAMAGTMIRDDATGVVTSGEGGAPDISYEVTPGDLDAWRAGTRLVVRAYFAAGARRVAPAIGDLRFYDDEASALAAVETLRGPGDVAQPYGSHPHGTCRMGPKDGPHRGVVDVDAQVHGTPGLYVMDGSIFPTTLGVNPQVTIMAIATMLARRLAR
jgi:choline dehydrogenase-like flavoprotein